jgi:hypothetical protein
MKSKTTISYKYESTDNKKEKESLNLVFHNNIEKMDYHLLVKTCMLIFDSYKALDYKNSDEKVLAQIEWHSWQVSLLLSLIQKNGQLFLPDLKNHIPSTILQMPKESVEFEINRIKKKYYENVNISKNRDQLSKHVIWSVKEVSLIFYYLTFSRNS